MALNGTLSSNMTLVSDGGVFELGFTSGTLANQSSAVYALAIWYAQPPAPARTVVWVADRSMALGMDCSLKLSEQGDLQVYTNSSNLVWTSNTVNLNVTSATVLDTGNLVLLNTANQVVWQSFDTPTDTLLPNQTFPADGSRVIIAWQNVGDWSEGNYSLAWSNQTSLIAYWQNPCTWYGSPNYAYWPWFGSGKRFSFAVLTPDGYFRARDVGGNSSTVIATSAGLGAAAGRLLRLTLDEDGNLRMYSWSIANSTWSVVWQALDDVCAVSGHCGPYAVCGASKCTCPEGFQLVDAADVRLGRRRIIPISTCSARNISAPVTDTFGPMVNVDWGLVADYDKDADLDFLPNVNVSTCKNLCLANCQCEAAVMSSFQSDGDSVTCWLKRDVLLNGTANSQHQSYLKIAGSTLQDIAPAPSKAPRISVQTLLTVLTVTFGGILALLLCGLGSFCFAWKVRKRRSKRLQDKWAAAKSSMVRFTYHEIVLMTGNFGLQIGKGGFGTVFKGYIGHPQFPASVTVAMKGLDNRLTSEAEKEFLNEVESIGCIHHVHLVSLLGYCAEADHRLLVYEYVERGSLEFLPEGKSGPPVLEWRPRFAISIQTAKGLAYLHDDCHLQIIHCDVKPENILLDSTNSAKVADFGISRVMKRDQTLTVTMHIRGTRGYLAPEYWMPDQVTISNKVDVFSYGMVLVEIVGGRRNLQVAASPSEEEDAPDMYFPTWAFSKLETDSVMDVVDPALTGIVSPEEVRRALQVAFWCINENPHLRPSMSDVVQMLQGHMAIDLPVPRPEFFYNSVGGSHHNPLEWSTDVSSNPNLLQSEQAASANVVASSSLARF